MTNYTGPITRHLDKLKSTVEAFMADECVIERPSDRSLDTSTGVESVGQGTEIYSGKCRITPTSERGEEVVGEEMVSWRDTDFYIPLSAPEIHQDDLLTVTSATDAEMVGRVWRITDVRQATYQTSRQLSAQSLKERRTTEQL